jgi:hypothetical protein
MWDNSLLRRRFPQGRGPTSRFDPGSLSSFKNRSVCFTYLFHAACVKMKRVVWSWECIFSCIDCARLPRAAVHARQSSSFVYALITVFVSSIEARLLIDATSTPQLKEHSTLKSLCRGTKNRSDLTRHAPSSRAAIFVLPLAATWDLLCEAKQGTLLRAAAARNRYPALESQARFSSTRLEWL